MQATNLDPYFPRPDRVYDVLTSDGYRCTVDVLPPRARRLWAVLRRLSRHQQPVCITAYTPLWHQDIRIVGSLFRFAELPSITHGPLRKRIGVYILPFDSMSS